VVYAAGTISLAALETLAHVSMDNFPPMTLTTIDLPDELSIMELGVDSLPVEWTAYPAPPVLGELGDAWFDAGDTVALRVPSVIVPQEYNYLFNTNHPSFDDVMIIEQATFEFDPRLYGAK